MTETSSCCCARVQMHHHQDLQQHRAWLDPHLPFASTPTMALLSTPRRLSTLSLEVGRGVVNVGLYHGNPIHVHTNPPLCSPNTDPMQLSMLEMQIPALAAVIKTKDVERLQALLRETHAVKKEHARKQQLLMTGDPMDPEVQVGLHYCWVYGGVLHHAAGCAVHFVHDCCMFTHPHRLSLRSRSSKRQLTKTWNRQWSIHQRHLPTYSCCMC